MIYAHLRGRLGNQMFIFAFAYALSRENGNEPIALVCNQKPRICNFSLRNIAENPGRYDRTILTKSLQYVYAQAENKWGGIGKQSKLQKFEKVSSNIYQREGLFYCQNGYLPFKRSNCHKKDIALSGYFQSEKYFHNFEDEIREMFRPKHIPQHATIDQIMAASCPVCVDIRLGDYVNNPLHGVCNMDYYRQAMHLIVDKIKNPTFFMFSSEVAAVQEQFADLPYSIVFEDSSLEDYEKQYAMSLCHHFIMTNSTYDWWAQYLSRNHDKTVIAPSRWFNGDCPCDIYQDNWITIEC